GVWRPSRETPALRSGRVPERFEKSSMRLRSSQLRRRLGCIEGFRAKGRSASCGIRIEKDRIARTSASHIARLASDVSTLIAVYMMRMSGGSQGPLEAKGQ